MLLRKAIERASTDSGGGVGSSSPGEILYNNSGALDGVAPFTFDGTDLTLASGQLVVPDGTVAAPSIRFSASSNSGIWSPGAEVIQISTGAGLGAFQVAGTGAGLPNADDMFYIGGTDTRLYRDNAAGVLMVQNGTAANAAELRVYGTASASGPNPATFKNISITHNGTEGRITTKSDGSAGALQLGTTSGVTWEFADDGGGSFRPVVDNSRTLGTASNRPSTLYLGTSAVNALGTAGAPSYTFTGDTDTGVYSSTANNVSVAAGGSKIVDINSSGIIPDATSRELGSGASPFGACFANRVQAAAGSAAAPAFTINGDADTGIYSPLADRISVAIAGVQIFNVRSNLVAVLNDSASFSLGTNADINMYRDAAGTLGIRHGTSTSPAIVRIAGTSGGGIDPVNHERLVLTHNGTIGKVFTEAGGTGVDDGTQIEETGGKLGFLGATPIVRPSSTGETTGFTAGAGTSVNDDSTFTGNVGSTAYRISDIVKHLKNIGLIAA